MRDNPKNLLKKYDAVAVLGGGVDHVTGQIHPWVQNRFDKASEIPSKYLIALSHGTFNLPPVMNKKTGFPVLESMAGLNYFAEKYGDQGRVLIPDFGSLDTVGNQYFLRMHIAGPLKIKSIAIITSEFHMPRTMAITKWVFGLKPARKNYQIDFITVPNVGMDKTVLTDRVAREERSLQVVSQNSKTITTLAKFAKWLFTKHNAYSQAGWNTRKTIKGPAAKSY